MNELRRQSDRQRQIKQMLAPGDFIDDSDHKPLVREHQSTSNLKQPKNFSLGVPALPSR
jgi:hypothetical protein